MALSTQGFTIRNNLSEAFFDRTIFNNLAGSPQGSDITLLFNNKRNTSSLTVTSQNITGNNVAFTNTNAVFSNRTAIKVNTSTYYVKNSNGIDTFQLSSLPDLSNTVAPPTGTYIRSDEITLSNISNLSAKRRPALGNSDSNLSDFNIGNTIYYLFERSQKALLLDTEANLGFYKFRSSKSLNKKANFLGEKPLTLNGLLIIKDPDGVNQLPSGLTNTSPGLFIYNSDTNSGIRAFSSSSNPWEDPSPSTGYLETTALQFTAGKLTISNPAGLVIQPKGSVTLSTSTTTTSISTSTFTHKLPVTINGELYYLCLRRENP